MKFEITERRAFARLFFIVSVSAFFVFFPHRFANKCSTVSVIDSYTKLVKAYKIPKSFNEIVSPGRKSKTKHDRFDVFIYSAADKYKVDPALVKAVIFAESSYNPKAVSKTGAMGLMQLMPGTAKELGVIDSFEPEHNIHGGVKYLSILINRFDGDIRLALAAYNAGSRKVREYNGVPPFKATRYYINKVYKYYGIYKSQNASKV